MNTPTYITIVSSNGVIRVDRQTGKVIGRRIDADADLEYHTVYQFDLDEYFAWDKGSDRATCEEIDIVGINYTYLDAEGNAVEELHAEGWRKDVEIFRKEDLNTGLIADYESSLDTTACELLTHATAETKDLYYTFSRSLQADLRAKFGDVFENFRAPSSAFRVTGYYEDEGEANLQEVIMWAYDDAPPEDSGYTDDDIFFYGVNERDLDAAIKDKTPFGDFIVTKWEYA